MSGLKTIKDFIKENKAPRGAKYIGVFKDGEENTQKRVDIRYTNLVNNEEDTPLFRFGVLSDVHVNAMANLRNEDRGERMCECKYDFLNAMRYFQENGAKFVCISGDLVLSGEEKNKKNNGMRDWELVKDIMNMYQISGNTTSEPIPIFSCFGNHDTYDALETFVGSDGNYRLYQSLDANTNSYPRIFGTNIYYNNGTFHRLNSSQTSSITDYITWSGDTAVVDDFKRADDKIMNWIDKWKDYTFETNNMDKVSGVTNGKVVFQIFEGQEVDASEEDNVVKFGDDVIGINTFNSDGNFKDLKTKTTGSFFFEYNINGETYVFIFFSVYNGIDFESYIDEIKNPYESVGSVYFSNGVIKAKSNIKERDIDPLTGELLETHSLNSTDDIFSSYYKAGDYVVDVESHSSEYGDYYSILNIQDPDGSTRSVEVKEMGNTIYVQCVLSLGGNKALVPATTSKGDAFYELDLISGELSKLELHKVNASRRYDELSQELKTKSRLYRTVGTFCGVLTASLLL